MPAFYNPLMALPIDVCIRGAGIVGRTLALLLARERLNVGLVAHPDGPASSAGDVRAYALNSASKLLLEQLRAWPGDPHATPVKAMQIRGDEGGEVNFSAAAQNVPALAWIVDVVALQDRLAEALRFQSMVQWLPEAQPAALTVVCEGKASATRAEFGVQFDATPYPQRAIAARLHCENNHGHVARQWFQDGDILAFLPLGGPDDGNSVAIVWSVREPRAQSLLELESRQFESRVTAASHAVLGKATLTSERACWPLQLARADRWCGPGWALAGDAAHTVHPLAGQGLNLGLADAAELAAVVSRRENWRGVGDEKLLRRYERARKAGLVAMGATTDGLQQMFDRDAQPWAYLRGWGMRGFDRSGPVKRWAARRAMGLTT